MQDALLVGVLEGVGNLDADPRHASKVLSLGLGGQLRLMTGDRRIRWIHSSLASQLEMRLASRRILVISQQALRLAGTSRC